MTKKERWFKPGAAMSTKKVIPIKNISSWSFSRYSTYKQCPLKLKLSAIDKISEPTNEAMQRGVNIHKMAEDYIKGTLSRLPPELKLFKDEFSKLRKLYKKTPDDIVVEDNWAFTKNWAQTTWNNWALCWVRIKLDAAHYEENDVLVVTDWKSGKFRPESNEEYLEQLELYALGAFLLDDNLQKVKPRLAYTDEGRIYPNGSDEPELVYTRKDIPRLKKLWEKRTKPMLSDTTFAPRPNDKCRWCWYGQSKKAVGGPGVCKY